MFYEKFQRSVYGPVGLQIRHLVLLVTWSFVGLGPIGLACVVPPPFLSRELRTRSSSPLQLISFRTISSFMSTPTLSLCNFESRLVFHVRHLHRLPRRFGRWI